MLIPLLLWSCLAALTAPLVIADVRWLRLPNPLVLAGATAVVATEVLGGIARGLGDVTPSWQPASSFAAAGAALAVFAALRMLGAIGMGDVKLAGVLAGALGFLPATVVVPALELALLVAAAGAGVSALALLTTMTARTEWIPCGPFLLAGFWFALLQNW